MRTIEREVFLCSSELYNLTKDELKNITDYWIEEIEKYEEKYENISFTIEADVHYEYGECYPQLNLIINYMDEMTEDEIKKEKEIELNEQRLEHINEFFEFQGECFHDKPASMLLQFLEEGFIKEYTIKDLDAYMYNL